MPPEEEERGPAEEGAGEGEGGRQRWGAEERAACLARAGEALIEAQDMAELVRIRDYTVPV